MRDQLGERVAVPLQEELDDIISPCYLCHGQCASSGAQGKGGRPCARGVSEILHRRHERRLRAGLKQ